MFLDGNFFFFYKLKVSKWSSKFKTDENQKWSLYFINVMYFTIIFMAFICAKG